MLTTGKRLRPDDVKFAKEKRKLDVGNDRPVSNLYCVSKLLEKIVYFQV